MLSEDKRSLLREYRLFIKVFFQDLFDDRIGFYAASMSWSTLFFMIPFMVILLVLFTHMPIFDTTYQELHKLIAKNMLSSDSNTIMKYIDQFVANADKLGFIGVAYVFIATLLFFKDYDFIVNDIFETPKRTIFGAFRTYFILLLFLPLMLGSSLWLSENITKYIDGLGFSKTIHIYYVIPYLIIWLLFYIAYQFSPQTHISPRASVISSFATSLIWYLSKSIFLLSISISTL